MFRPEPRPSRSMWATSDGERKVSQSKHVKPQHVLRRAKRKLSRITQKLSYSSKESRPPRTSQRGSNSATSSKSRPSQSSRKDEKPRDGNDKPESQTHSRSSSLDTIVHHISRHAMVKGYRTKPGASGEYAVSGKQAPAYGRTLLDLEISDSPKLASDGARARNMVTPPPARDVATGDAPRTNDSIDVHVAKVGIVMNPTRSIKNFSVLNPQSSEGRLRNTTSDFKTEEIHTNTVGKIEKQQTVDLDSPKLQVAKKRPSAKKTPTSDSLGVVPLEVEQSHESLTDLVSADITKPSTELQNKILKETITDLRRELTHCKQDIQDQKAKSQSTISSLRAELNSKASLEKTLKNLQHSIRTRELQAQDVINHLRSELSISERQLKNQDNQAAKAQTAITSLHNQLAACHAKLDSSHTDVQKARETLSQRKLLMQELGALQTSNAVVEAKYRNLKTAYQSGQDACSILGPGTIVMKKVMYKQQRQRLVQLQKNRDEKVVGLKKNLKQTEKLMSEYKSLLVGMTEDRDTWQKGQEALVRDNEKAFKGLAEKMTDAEAQIRLVGAHESVIRQMRELQKAHGGYQRQYEQLVREREEAVMERKIVEESKQVLEGKIVEGEEKLRVKGEEVTDLEIQNEVLKAEAEREQERMEVKMQGLEAIVKGLRIEMDHLKVTGVDEKVKEVVDKQSKDLRKMQETKDALETEVKNLQASLKLREFHEVDKWVSVAEEASRGVTSRNADEWELDERLNINEMQSEWSPFKTGLGTVLGVSTFIREQAVREAAEEETTAKKEGSLGGWETDSSEN